MIDLHSHTLFSDGVLLPSELIRRAEAKGLRALAIADHVDMSNIDLVVPRLVRACTENNAHRAIKAIPGVEITHVPNPLLKGLVSQARELGAELVLVHGESPVEPVASGTNRAAIEAGADILTHPGEITEADARLAAEKGVYLEITARKGHNLANRHVAQMAARTGALLVLNTDTHVPDDLIDDEGARQVAQGAWIDEAGYARIRENMAKLAGLENV